MKDFRWPTLREGGFAPSGREFSRLVFALTYAVDGSPWVEVPAGTAPDWVDAAKRLAAWRHGERAKASRVRGYRPL